MFNMPEGQIDAGLGDAVLLGNLVLAVLLRRTRHNQQAAVGQSFGKCQASIALSQSE